MQQKSNIKWRRLNELTKLLDINNIDIVTIITDIKPSNEQVCITDGPSHYNSGMYSVVSIKDFK
jgi:hypothetical protein